MEIYWVQCHISLSSCDLVVSSWVALADVQGHTICGSKATEFVIFSLKVQTGLPTPSGMFKALLWQNMQINVSNWAEGFIQRASQKHQWIFSFGGHTKPLAP